MKQVTPYTNNLWHNRTVGLLGGSFNPAHAGHRHISLYALKMLGLDAVWWMVSPQNPLKPVTGMQPLINRMATARQVANHPRIIVTDIEQHTGTRYTVETLKTLKQLFPTTRFVWLMGTDNLRQIHRWKDWEDIFAMIPVCVLDRPPRGNALRSCKALERFRSALTTLPALVKTQKPPVWTILHIPLNPLSATDLRKKGKKAIMKK